ncbi:hypothetical protein T484DRAFT_1866144 [Baffinella frigidus]|nr:hypothetical protein T484DRAFT_1866144 [Cryptophyta sp. CCMP2293]
MCGGWPIGSTCANRVGSVCRTIAVTSPPRVELSDAFGNLVLSGSYAACAELLNADGQTLEGDKQTLQGDKQAPLVSGVATFSSISMPLKGEGYRLAFTFVTAGAACGDPGAMVGEVSFSAYGVGRRA